MTAITPEEQAAFDHFELRAYQIKAVLAVRQLFREGKRNVLVCAPTAAGKTRIAACILRLTHDHGKRANFVVDRENLVTQTSGTFDSFKIDHGVIKQKHWRYRPYERVQISSVQTLMRRGWPEADLIVVDECHTVYQTTTTKLKARESYALGLTATPFTKGLGQVYDALVNVETTNNLIEQGALVPFRIFSPSQPNMTGVRVNSKGEWSDDEATKRALEVVGDCVAEYLKHGNAQKFICSAVTIAHARELHRQFTAAGVVCSVYTSLEDEDECDAIVGEFHKPDSYIRGLITVSKATKGFDVPDVGCVIMARPLRKSLADHIQFLGRGLRTFPGKTECIVLDHSGNCERFWEEMNEFFETGALELDDGTKKPKVSKKRQNDQDVMAKCPHCSALHKAAPHCPSCGHEYPRRATVEHVAGTLEEMLAAGNQRKLVSDIWPQVCAYARAAAPDDVPRARSKAYAMYKQLTGSMAKADFYSTPPVKVGPDVRKKLENLDKAYWVKRRAVARQSA